jgi:hypothetical protein
MFVFEANEIISNVFDETVDSIERDFGKSAINDFESLEWGALRRECVDVCSVEFETQETTEVGDEVTHHLCEYLQHHLFRTLEPEQHQIRCNGTREEERGQLCVEGSTVVSRRSCLRGEEVVFIVISCGCIFFVSLLFSLQRGVHSTLESSCSVASESSHCGAKTTLLTRVPQPRSALWYIL